MDNCDPLVDCINTPYSFACGYCPSGYVDSYRDRTRCDDIDECGDGTHNCDALATCTNNPGSFACGGCPAGYADTNSDGTLCDDIDECADPFTCNANATCQNSNGGFACICNNGFEGDGETCSVIDGAPTGGCSCRVDESGGRPFAIALSMLTLGLFRWRRGQPDSFRCCFFGLRFFGLRSPRRVVV